MEHHGDLSDEEGSHRKNSVLIPLKISRGLINIVSKIVNIFLDSHKNIKPLFNGPSIEQTEATEL